MRKKLEAGEYPNPEKFKDDFELMIRNCMAFNPSGTIVHDAGVGLDKIFKMKWAAMPPLRPPQQSEDEEEEEEEEEDDDATRMCFPSFAVDSVCSDSGSRDSGDPH